MTGQLRLSKMILTAFNVLNIESGFLGVKYLRTGDEIGVFLFLRKKNFELY